MQMNWACQAVEPIFIGPTIPAGNKRDPQGHVLDALKAMNLCAAWQHFEDEDKWSVKVGKLAELVILSNDPTSVDLEALDSLKEGKTLFEFQTK
jgi:predicted amidohydrolase YtcJ